MNAENMWMAFMETGAPELYLLFKRAQMMEEHNVLDTQGTGVTNKKL